jgi:hypothetical protein
MLTRQVGSGILNDDLSPRHVMVSFFLPLYKKRVQGEMKVSK